MKRSSFLKSLLGIPLIGVVVKEISAKELVSSENVIAQSNSGGHVPNWRNTSSPPMTQSMYGVIHNYQSDGCGNYRWSATPDRLDGFDYKGRVILIDEANGNSKIIEL